MRTSSMTSGIALLADRNFQSFCRNAAAISTTETIINESDFPSLGVRSSPSFTPSLPTTSYGNLSPIPTHQVGIFSKDALSALQRTPYEKPTISYAMKSIPAMNLNCIPNFKAHESAMLNNRPISDEEWILANLMRGVTDGSSTSNNSEFHIQNEDFPALPGANHLGSHSISQMQNMENSSEERSTDQAQSSDPNKPGIQTHPDGRVTNIPPGMLNDQYGMAGLLTFLRTIESDPSIVTLALGHDLTNLGLNLNSSERNLYQSFGGPWAEQPVRVQDLDTKVPEEYLTNAAIRDKLPNIKLAKLSDDVLFYLFYNFPGEVYQMAAASELYARDWRYHKIEGVWLTRSAFGGIKEQTGSYEKGSYNVFDPIQWRKGMKEMTVNYLDLEGKIEIPPDFWKHLNYHSNSNRIL